MTKEELLIIKYLAKDGYKNFDGEILSNGDRVLGKKVAENRTLEEQYKDALALEREGLVTITKVVKGEIGNPELLLAVWVELTQKGIQYIEENKKNW